MSDCADRDGADLCCPPDDGADGPSGSPLRSPEADAELAAFARAVSHPVRVRILRLLASKDRRRCSHLVDELPLAQSTVSEHLRILRGAGLVQVAERGADVGYCLVPSALARLTALVQALHETDASAPRAVDPEAVDAPLSAGSHAGER